MRVVGRGDDDGVEVLLLVEHLAEVGVGLGLGKPLGHLAQVQRIDVAQGDDVFAGQVIDVVGALVGHADAGQVELFVGPLRRQCRSRPNHGAGGQRGRAGQHGLSQKFASFQMFGHGRGPRQGRRLRSEPAVPGTGVTCPVQAIVNAPRPASICRAVGGVYWHAVSVHYNSA